MASLHGPGMIVPAIHKDQHMQPLGYCPIYFLSLHYFSLKKIFLLTMSEGVIFWSTTPQAKPSSMVSGILILYV
jgi:hypothetical protein